MAGEDAPQGPGWWQAGDGRWYPPASATPPPLAPPFGEPPPSAPLGDGALDGSFFGNLFDLSMTKFVTPSIIKVLYVLAIVLVSLVSLLFLLASINNDQAALGLIFAPLYWIIGIIYARVLLELVIVLFRIERNTRPLRGSPPPPGPP